jgi:hypothetical protein
VADLTPDRCARCGRALDPDDCFRVVGQGEGDPAGFCRLEHIVAWVLRGADPVPPLTLTHHRLGHEIVDEFGSVDELRAWASGGGRWGREAQ